MALFAQIKFTQDAVVGTEGTAFVGTVGSIVTTTHDPGETESDPPGSWTIVLLYAPPGSGYEFAVPVELGAADTDTPTADFTPDVTGTYRLQLKIWAQAGQAGPNSVDIRDFIIPEPKHGFVVPPYQQDPAPLPTPASGSASARANELNVNNQPYGWTGRGDDGLLAQFIKQVDASNFDIVPDPMFTGGVLKSIGGIADLNYPFDAVAHGDSVWFVNSGIGNGANGFIGAGVTRVSRSSGKITERVLLPNPSPTSSAAYAVSTGSQLFLVSVESDFTTYVSVLLRPINVGSPGSTTFGTPITLLYEASLNTPFPTGIVFDPINYKLWVSYARSSGQGGVIGISLNTMTPDAPVLLTPGAGPGPIVIDTDISHYADGAPRLFVGEAATGIVHRLSTLGGTITPEAGFATATAKGYALAIGGGAAGLGGGRVYVGGMDTGGINSYTTVGTLIAGPIVTPPIFTLVYVPANDSLVGAIQIGNHIELGSFDAATITTPLAGPTALPPTDETAGPGVGTPFRYTISGTTLYAFSPSTDNFNSTKNPIGRAFRLDAVTLALIDESVTRGSAQFLHSDRILWRLDGTGDVTTWAEIMTAIGQNKTPVTIVLDQPGTYPIPPGAPGPAVVYDMKQARFEAKEGPHDQILVQIQRFAVLYDLHGHQGGMRLQHNHLLADAVGPPLTFPPTITPTYVVGKGATMLGLASPPTDVPMIAVTNANPEFYLAFNELGTAHKLVGAPAATVDVGVGAILNVVALSGGLGIDAPQDPGWISSNGAATVNWIHDGSMYFAGNFWNGLHPANLGTNVNQALGQNGGSGPPGFEPVYQGGGPPAVGCTYWNVSTETMYVWNGVAWVTPNKSVTVGITASTTQTQGNGALTSDVNQVSVCANANDTVTLPAAMPGREVIVINSGANALQVFPASGDDLGAGVDTSTTQAAGVTNRYVAYDTTNWVKL